MKHEKILTFNNRRGILNRGVLEDTEAGRMLICEDALSEYFGITDTMKSGDKIRVTCVDDEPESEEWVKVSLHSYGYLIIGGRVRNVFYDVTDVIYEAGIKGTFWVKCEKIA